MVKIILLLAVLIVLAGVALAVTMWQARRAKRANAARTASAPKPAPPNQNHDDIPRGPSSFGNGYQGFSSRGRGGSSGRHDRRHGRSDDGGYTGGVYDGGMYDGPSGGNDRGDTGGGHQGYDGGSSGDSGSGGGGGGD